MNRNESFPALDVSTVTVHLAWASLEMIVDDVEDIQVLVSGDAGDVEDLKLLCQEAVSYTHLRAHETRHALL